MKENIETKDVQRTEYLDKNGLDMLWAKVKENTLNLVEVERNRATTQENRIIETKADKSELHSSYVSNLTFTALLEKVAANTDAISDKLDAGNYLSYKTLNNEGYYEIPSVCVINEDNRTATSMASDEIKVNDESLGYTIITTDGVSNKYATDFDFALGFSLNSNGIKLQGGDNNHVLTSNGSTIDITEYAKKTDILEVDASKYIKIADNITTGINNLVKRVDTINNNIGVGDNRSMLAYIGKGELGAIGYNSDGYAVETFKYSITYGLETTNTNGYKGVKIPCDHNKISIYKYNSNNSCTDYRYSGITLGENNDDNNLLNTNGSYKTIGTDITPLENGKVPAKYLDLPLIDTSDFVSKTTTDAQIINSSLAIVGEDKVVQIVNSIADEDPINVKLSFSGLEFNGGDRSTITLNASDVNSNNRSRIIIEAYNENPNITLLNNVGSDFAFHNNLTITSEGISNSDNNANHVYATDGSIADLTQYTKKTDLPTVPTKVSQLLNDSEFIAKSVYDEKIAVLEARIAALEAKHTETA